MSRKEPVTEEEDFALQLSMEDFKCSLKKVENYKTEAERAVGSLEQELTSYLIKEGFVAAVRTAAVAVAAGGKSLMYTQNLFYVDFGNTKKVVVGRVPCIALEVNLNAVRKRFVPAM